MCPFPRGPLRAILTSLAPPDSSLRGHPCLPRQPVPQVRARRLPCRWKEEPLGALPQDRWASAASPSAGGRLQVQQGPLTTEAPLRSDKPDRQDKLRQDEWSRPTPGPARVLILTYFLPQHTLYEARFLGPLPRELARPPASQVRMTPVTSPRVSGTLLSTPASLCSIHSKGHRGSEGGDVPGPPSQFLLTPHPIVAPVSRGVPF